MTKSTPQKPRGKKPVAGWHRLPMPRAKRAAIALLAGAAAAGIVHHSTRASVLDPKIANANRQVMDARRQIEKIDDRFFDPSVGHAVIPAEHRFERDRQIGEFRAGQQRLKDLKAIKKWKVPATLGAFVIGASGIALLLSRRGKKRLLQKALSEGVLYDHRYQAQPPENLPDIMLVPLVNQGDAIFNPAIAVWKAKTTRAQRLALNQVETALAKHPSVIATLWPQYPGRFMEFLLKFPVGRNWPQGPYLILMKETVHL